MSRFIEKKERFFRKGDFIFHEGEIGNCAYLVQSGEVQVYTTRGSKETELALLQAGEIFGEMALLIEMPRTASVRASKDTNVILIEKDIFEEKMERSDPTIRAILQMLVRRIMAFNEIMSGKKSELGQLISAVESAYKGVLSALPPTQQEDFKKQIEPKMEGFLHALRNFSNRLKV